MEEGSWWKKEGGSRVGAGRTQPCNKRVCGCVPAPGISAWFGSDDMKNYQMSRNGLLVPL